MIAKTTFDFLELLAKNNNREWFNDNKKLYNQAKQDFEEAIAKLISLLKKMDPFIGDLEPKQCIFRLFRDVRFSKNKEPYKTNFGAAISKGGRKGSYPGYYIHVKPGGESFFAGGLYMPDSKILASIRQEISYNHQDFDKIVSNKNFVEHFKELEGESLKRPPKGYDAEHPAINFLKMKSFLMLEKVPDKVILGKNANDYAMESFKAMKPLNEFFRGPVADIVETSEE